MSRPLLAPHLRREWIYSVYLTEAEYRAISRAAMRKELAVAKFLREAMMEKLEREKGGAG